MSIYICIELVVLKGFIVLLAIISFINLIGASDERKKIKEDEYKKRIKT